MKQSMKDFIDGLVYRNQNWTGDIIDLSDRNKDALCHEWLSAYPTWQADYLPFAAINQIEGYVHILYSFGDDPASIALKNAIYLELELAMREPVQEYFSQTYVKAEAFAGYERGE
jgi:hypothetical protein